jgi:hypothetical protein
MLDNLFFQIESLEEVDLSHLTADDLISASDMFHGCKDLENVIFGNDLETKNLINISNRFSG